MRTRSVATALILAIVVAGCGRGPDLGSREEPVTYVAEIEAAALGDPPLPESFSGTWELVLEGDRYRLSQDEFGTITEAIQVEGDRLFVVAVPAPEGAFNCYGMDGGRVSELLRARYAIEADGDTLELGKLHEPCPLREAILARTWRRDASR